jgi:hypothetical protein
MTPTPGTVRYDSLSSFDIANEMQAHQRGVRVVAFDLDGTLAEELPDLALGEPIPHTIKKLVAEHEEGSYIIIYTTRLNQRLWGAQEFKLHQHLIFQWLSKHGLAEYVTLLVGDKPYADVYWDNRARNPQELEPSPP